MTIYRQFPRHAGRVVFNAYSVFRADHFDVHAVFYLIMDINFFLPSVTITINSLTTPLHLEHSFHLKLWLNLFQPLSVCRFVCVNSHMWERRRADGMQGNIFTVCNSFEDNSSLLSRCDQLDCFPFLHLLRQIQNQFSSSTICALRLAVIDFIYGFCGGYAAVIKSSTSLLTHNSYPIYLFTGLKLTLIP